MLPEHYCSTPDTSAIAKRALDRAYVDFPAWYSHSVDRPVGTPAELHDLRLFSGQFEWVAAVVNPQTTITSPPKITSFGNYIPRPTSPDVQQLSDALELRTEALNRALRDPPFTLELRTVADWAALPLLAYENPQYRHKRLEGLLNVVAAGGVPYTRPPALGYRMANEMDD